MTRATPDPTRWLTDLLESGHLRWPAPDVSAVTKAMTAATEPWTKAVGDLTKLQWETFSTLTKGWAAMLPTAAAEPIADRRFADEAWTKDPRYAAVARTYLAQTDQLRKALDAAPLDERTKAQWGFALGQVMDALSPANMLATNPEAIQLALETGGKSLVEGMRLLHRGPRAGPHLDDRRDGVRGGPQRRHHAGHGRLPERADPADPVHADHREGLRAPAGDRAAVHQQVLHPRPAAGELLRRPRGREGHHGVPGVLAQRGRRAGHTDLGRLPGARRARRDRRGARHHQGRQGQHARVLHRRHVARQRPRGPCRPRRAHRGEHDAADVDARLQRHRRHRAAGHPRRRAGRGRRRSARVAWSRAARWPRCSRRCAPTT